MREAALPQEPEFTAPYANIDASVCPTRIARAIQPLMLAHPTAGMVTQRDLRRPRIYVPCEKCRLERTHANQTTGTLPALAPGTPRPLSTSRVSQFPPQLAKKVSAMGHMAMHSAPIDDMSVDAYSAPAPPIDMRYLNLHRAQCRRLAAYVPTLHRRQSQTVLTNIIRNVPPSKQHHSTADCSSRHVQPATAGLVRTCTGSQRGYVDTCHIGTKQLVFQANSPCKFSS
jgi:hypothetical protein